MIYNSKKKENILNSLFKDSKVENPEFYLPNYNQNVKIESYLVLKVIESYLYFSQNTKQYLNN